MASGQNSEISQIALQDALVRENERLKRTNDVARTSIRHMLDLFIVQLPSMMDQMEQYDESVISANTDSTRENTSQGVDQDALVRGNEGLKKNSAFLVALMQHFQDVIEAIE